MRIEDLLLLEGWDWKGEVKKYENVEPGTEMDVAKYRGKGYFYGALAVFAGSSDARYAGMLVNIDNTFYMPLYPYGLRVMGLDMWTPYGTFVLKYDTVANIYIVAEIPGYLIPIKEKMDIKIVYPETTITIWGEHTNTDPITVYVLYLYVQIYDEDAFKRSIRELWGTRRV